MFYRTILLCLLLAGLAACGDDTANPVADKEVSRVIRQIRAGTAEAASAPAYVTRSELESLLRDHVRLHHGWDQLDHNHGDGFDGGYGGGTAYDHSHPPDHTHDGYGLR